MLKRRSHLLFMVVFLVVLQHPSEQTGMNFVLILGEGPSSHLGAAPAQPRRSGHSEPCRISGWEEILGQLPHQPQV